MPSFASFTAHLKRATTAQRQEGDSHDKSWLNALAGGLAVAAPLILSSGRGQLPLGLGVALGALSVSRVNRASRLGHRLKAPLHAFAAASLSILFAWLLSGYGIWSDIATIVLASGSVLLIRFSREVAIGVIRFMLFLIIFGNALETSTFVSGLAVAIFVGIAWTALLVTVLEVFAAGVNAEAQPVKARAGALKQLRRVARELRQLSQWDFPFRLAVGLSLALLVRILMQQHHFGWITVTVALVTPRQFEIWPIRATQRTLGTIAGVIATGVTFAVTLPNSLLIVLLVALGALRKWFEDRNYLAYSAVMAPLVLLLLAANHPAAYGLLYDRVFATLIGVALVLLSNLLAARSTAKSS